MEGGGAVCSCLGNPNLLKPRVCTKTKTYIESTMHQHQTHRKVIDASYTNEAYKRMEKGDVQFRFVIDVNKSMIA